MKSWIDLLRVRQWIKNCFMFAPLIFSGHFDQSYLWLQSLWAVFGFCLISSGMYIINDIVDLEQDQKHPRKSHRPLAARKIQIPIAKTVAALLLILGVLSCFMQSREIFVLAICYVLLHVLYNLRLKSIAILDVFTIAFGFELRIWAGAVAIAVVPSMWLQICMFVLALFLGFTKRRCAITYFPNYNERLLDQIIAICSTLAVLLYGLYATSAEVTERIPGFAMLYSLGFVVFGIFRYLYLLYIKKRVDDPSDALLSDIPLIINILVWIAFVMMTVHFAY